MKRLLALLWLAAMATLPLSQAASAQHSQYDALVATHAKTFAVPEALVHRVIVRESRYQPDLVGRGGTIGLMQIKLGTARGMGYTGDAEGLRDPNTNLLYGIKYLAGAYRVANGDHDRTIHYYAAGYYESAKQQRVRERLKPAEPVVASVPKAVAKPEEAAKPEEIAKVDGVAKLQQVVTPKEEPKTVLAPAVDAKPNEIAALPKGANQHKVAGTRPGKELRKKLAEAKELVKERVPRPPAPIPGANGAKPR